MQNKLYFPALKPANLKEMLCMAINVISDLAQIYSLNKQFATVTMINCIKKRLL